MNNQATAALLTRPAVKFDPALVSKYGVTGPRYTSYPTAASFHEGFDELAYRMFVAQSNEELIPRSLSLYVHLPFCRSLCYYCACNKKITQHASHGVSYLQMLEREIAMQGALFDPDREVIQLHLGGGTPTFFDDAQLAVLVDRLGESFRFAQSPRREFSIEVDPRTVDATRLAALASIGFNRLSMGIQDFDAAVQQAVNRVQDREQTLDLVRRARQLGFQSVSLDLIYGLPRQTTASFAATITAVLEVRPDRLSVYNYAHLPQQFRSQRLIRAEDVPEPAVRLALLEQTIDMLTAAGYVYIGMDHFALPGDPLARARADGSLQRNFQGYSTLRDCDLLGLGVSAIGHVGASYAQNHRNIEAWEKALKAERLPIWRGFSLDREDLIRQAVIESIMCTGSVSQAQIERQFGIDFEDFFALELKALEELEADGLLLRDEAGFSATASGTLLLRAIAMIFDEYHAAMQQGNRYSRII